MCLRLSQHREQLRAQQTRDPIAQRIACGRIFAALYELNDPELIAGLTAFGADCSLILANGAQMPDENADIRTKLKTTTRLSVGAAVEAARESEYFARAYIDQLSGGQPVFMFTKSDPLAEERLAAVLPSDTEFRIEEAARTERELLSVKDRIDDDVASLSTDGIEVVRVEFKASRNALRVGVHGLTSAVVVSVPEGMASSAALA